MFESTSIWVDIFPHLLIFIFWFFYLKTHKSSFVTQTTMGIDFSIQHPFKVPGIRLQNVWYTKEKKKTKKNSKNLHHKGHSPERKSTSPPEQLLHGLLLSLILSVHDSFQLLNTVLLDRPQSMSLSARSQGLNASWLMYRQVCSLSLFSLIEPNPSSSSSSSFSTVAKLHLFPPDWLLMPI